MVKAKAFLFDMDGTLVDSTAVVESEWVRFSQRFHLNKDEVIQYAHGRQTLDTVMHFIGDRDSSVEIANELDQRELVILEGIVALPGVSEILTIIPSHRWALVTSASRQLARNRMHAAGLPCPTIMICAEDVEEGKPSPEGYILAATALGYPIEECVVFEDAQAGIIAGNRSGAQVVAVNPNAIDNQTVALCATLEEIRIEGYYDSFLVSDSKINNSL